MSNDLLMLFLEDDTEDAPWMVMGTLQFDAAGSFYYSLRYYAERHHQPWFVAAMLPIRYTWRGSRRKRQLAPDVFVAFAPDHARPSFDVESEGGFPPFVLEVVSPASAERDYDDKRTAYAELGVLEYALFAPAADRPSELSGYRRNQSGEFEIWQPDDQGRFWSDVLGLYLVVQGQTVRAADREGQLIPAPKESVASQEAASEREALARREVVEAQAREALALREARDAERENERLRQEIDRLRRLTGE